MDFQEYVGLLAYVCNCFHCVVVVLFFFCICTMSSCHLGIHIKFLSAEIHFHSWANQRYYSKGKNEGNIGHRGYTSQLSQLRQWSQRVSFHSWVNLGIGGHRGYSFTAQRTEAVEVGKDTPSQRGKGYSFTAELILAMEVTEGITCWVNLGNGCHRVYSFTAQWTEAMEVI